MNRNRSSTHYNYGRIGISAVSLVIPSSTLPSIAMAQIAPVMSENRAATMVGTPGNDNVCGTKSANIIACLGGNDTKSLH
ncbi:MAG TPA: hypothetical protein VGE97_08550 [Nitrososphaera sp.]|jgi:hypothetical protein